MPCPVVRPIRALISWIDTIKGKVSSIVQPMPKADLRASLAVRTDSRRIVVGGSGNEPRTKTANNALQGASDRENSTIFIQHSLGSQM